LIKKSNTKKLIYDIILNAVFELLFKKLTDKNLSVPIMENEGTTKTCKINTFKGDKI